MYLLYTLLEFLLYFGVIGGGNIDQKLEESFKFFDIDGNGSLTREEMERMATITLRSNLQLAANRRSPSGRVSNKQESLL